MGFFDDSQHWDKLAREIRAQAELQTDPFNKRSLRLIAHHYEMVVVRARSRSLGEAKKSGVA